MRPYLSWIEDLTTNQGVVGSNPTGRTKCSFLFSSPNQPARSTRAVLAENVPPARFPGARTDRLPPPAPPPSPSYRANARFWRAQRALSSLKTRHRRVFRALGRFESYRAHQVQLSPPNQPARSKRAPPTSSRRTPGPGSCHKRTTHNTRSHSPGTLARNTEAFRQFCVSCHLKPDSGREYKSVPTVLYFLPLNLRRWLKIQKCRDGSVFSAIRPRRHSFHSNRPAPNRLFYHWATRWHRDQGARHWQIRSHISCGGRWLHCCSF